LGAGGHTCNLPLYKIPATGQVPQHHPGEASYVARHQVWDLAADPRQEAPIDGPAVEARLLAASHLLPAVGFAPAGNDPVAESGNPWRGAASKTAGTLVRAWKAGAKRKV
jgi:hypothetical protein